jgi:hypothetical protein
VPDGLNKAFDPHPEAGFSAEAMGIEDHTEIQGFFQSEKYYPDRDTVLNWYKFKEEIKESVWKIYTKDAVNNSVSISLRIDKDYASTREYFPLYPISYYRNALEKLEPSGEVLIFADRIDLAKEFFDSLKSYKLRFVSDLNAAQQLFLMSQCSANIIINSTFSWWGAWLNNQPGRRIVAPTHWCRNGIPHGITDILCREWILVPGTIPIWDDFQMWRLRHPLATISRAAKKINFKDWLRKMVR